MQGRSVANGAVDPKPKDLQFCAIWHCGHQRINILIILVSVSLVVFEIKPLLSHPPAKLMKMD